MTQPSARIVNQIKGESEMDERLQLYKPLAVIRDMKQVFFYVQISANSTVISPLRIFTNKGREYVSGSSTPQGGVQYDAVTPYNVPPYYTPLGTKRKFRLWEQMNSLMDVRVPKDKYFIELKLSEAQIETDPANWQKQRDFNSSKIPVIATGPAEAQIGKYELDRAYEVEYVIQDPPVTGVPPATTPVQGGLANVEQMYFKEAQKKSRPQPLFCRIPQLDNGEAYNWTVVNNGANNDDKAHNTVVLHGGMQYQELDLEFGHLVYKGKDTEYETFGNNLGDVSLQKPWDTILSGPGTSQEVNNYQNFEYLDYNWEWPNSEPQWIGAPGNTKYITNVGNKHIAPSARNGDILAATDDFGDLLAPELKDVYLQNPALKLNQQCSSVLFRFECKLIHSF